MKQAIVIVLAGFIGTSSVFAYTALEDNFNNGKGGWKRVGSTLNEGGVDWSTGHPVINLNTNSGQPLAIYHDIGSIALADGDTLRLTVDVKKAHTNASPGSLKVGFGYANAPFGDDDSTAVPLDGYVMSIPSGGSTNDPFVAFVDKDIWGDGSTVNFFNKDKTNLGEMGLDDAVSAGTNFTTVVFEITRMDTNLLFYGSIDGTAFSNTVSTTHATNMIDNFEFNTVGLAHAYENGLGNASYDNVRVELNPSAEIVELFTTSFDGATQPGGVDTPIDMAGTLNGVVVGTLDPGTGASASNCYLLREADFSEGSDMYATNYASTAAARLGDGVDLTDSTNLASAIANNAYLEFEVDSGKIAYDTLNFKLVKFAFTQNAGVTVRSSLDGYSADLVTFTNDVIQGAYAVAADLSSSPGFDSATNVTFRFYLYNEYAGTSAARKMGIDDIRLTGIPLAKTLFATDFEDASQAGGTDTPIDMGGTLRRGVSVSTLTNGAAIVNFIWTEDVGTSDGFYARAGAGTNPSSNLVTAVANNEYFEFKLTSIDPVDLEGFGFNLVKHGFFPFAGATLRSSLDGFTADLVTVTDASSAGIYPALVNLSGNADFQNFTSATFRIYLYDEYVGSNSRRVGIDNIQITGVLLVDALASTDFEGATQVGGDDTPIDMGGTVHSNLTLSSLSSGTGTVSFALADDTVSDGLYVKEGAGSNLSTNLTSAIANNEYFEFTVSSGGSFDLSRVSFDLVKQGFSGFAGATLRSSLDGYSADLVTVTDSGAAGVFPADAGLSSNPDFSGITVVTFRIYLYDDYVGTNARRIGIDNLQIIGVFAEVVGSPAAAMLTISAGPASVTISAGSLTEAASYQLQSRTNLTLGAWGNVGSPITGVTATNWVVTPAEPAEFYQVEGSN